MAPRPDEKPKAVEGPPRRLCYFNLGFARQKRVRRILELSGHHLAVGLPGPQDGVVVWGQSPFAHRGEKVARTRNCALIRVEDAFLRSIRPGRLGEGPMGLLIDPVGVHFDGRRPSRLEQILQSDDLDDSNLLDRARAGTGRLIAHDLSKYNNHDPDLPPPPPGYVLVVDQSDRDASVLASGATEATFHQMVADARAEFPHLPILIKAHPDAMAGLRKGSFATPPSVPDVTFFDQPVSPWALLQGAVAVYPVSSQLGFEAILAGHRPKIYGTPFYAGWGLTDDRGPTSPRRNRRLTKTQLFAGAMILAPVWYDPCRDRLCSFEEALDQIEAEVKAFRQDRRGHVAVGMRLWKRSHLQRFFGREKPLTFSKTMAAKNDRSVLVWGTASEGLSHPGLLRVEDGFLRSRGLGADLIPPLSLIVDPKGIYFDPNQPSRLEDLILSPLPPGGARRAENLQQAVIRARVSKYNLAQTNPDLPPGHRILVPGQVEDDASIRCGTTDIATNLALLQAVRSQNPHAVLVYKPHPDVEAGLRPGAITKDQALTLADVIAQKADPIALIEACDEVWTMTSLLGFEALIRGKPVTCLGAPFYAGWGLTRDLGPTPLRRRQAPDGHPLPRPSLLQLIHAALIAYPRYHDPISDRPCPPEVIIDRLSNGQVAPPGHANRILAKLQGAFSTHAHLWRRPRQ